MIGGVSWVDVGIVLVVAGATIKGLQRGFVREVGGLLAVAAAILAPWYYNGSLDGSIARATGANAAAAHALGMLATAILAYAIVVAATWLLGTLMRLPILGTGNALAGGLCGFVKAVVFVWIVLFIGLFFPLAPPVRASLQASRLAPYFTAYDAAIDRDVLAAVPVVARPFLAPYLNGQRH